MAVRFRDGKARKTAGSDGVARTKGSDTHPSAFNFGSVWPDRSRETVTLAEANLRPLPLPAYQTRSWASTAIARTRERGVGSATALMRSVDGSKRTILSPMNSATHTAPEAATAIA